MNEILQELPPLPEVGLLNLFIKHTSAALSVNENADPDVRVDMEYILDNLVPDVDPHYIHTAEGPDDASSHTKTSLIGPSLTIPIMRGRLNLEHGKEFTFWNSENTNQPDTSSPL